MGEGDTLLNAAIGAVVTLILSFTGFSSSPPGDPASPRRVVTLVLSFTGFSPILGGMAAGYLQRGDRAGGTRVGALAGALAAVPFLLLFLLFGGFFSTGSMMGGGMGVPGGFLFFFPFAFVSALVWSVGLSALGGYLGVYVATETEVGS